MKNAFNKFIRAKQFREAYDCACLIHEYAYTEKLRAAIRENVTDANLRIYRQTYDFWARERFDDFMLALEWNRPAEEQFWLPRREKLLPVCEKLQELEDNKLDELFLSMPPRVGKALADDTPVLTKDGWKKHGDLVVGDEVIGINGEFKKVIAVHPKCQLDRMVTFSNGEQIVCHENHEWYLHDRPKQKTHTLETKQIESRKIETGGEKGHRGHRYNFQLPLRGMVQGEEKDMPLKPYTLGVWLGDGTNRNPTVCNDACDFDIIQGIRADGYRMKWVTEHKTTGVLYFGFDIRSNLQEMGMCHSRKRTPKHIPQEYLTASVEQRLELLAGLIDTDGSLTRKEHRYHFCTCDVELKDSFLELIATFGWRASVKVCPPTVSSTGVHGRKDTYVIGFNPTCYIPCRLERKQLHEFSKPRKVALESIEKVKPRQGNCITVEGDGLYLVGKNMIPTHNSTIIVMFQAWVMLRNSERSNLYCTYTASVAETFYDRVMEIFDDPYTYRWKELFPESKVASTNRKDLTMNLDRKKGYASLTARSLYANLNGGCDCNGYEIADDLHSGIEEALSKDRLNTAWARVTNNYLPRAKEGAKRLWIGTRWSMADCIARRLDILENDPKSAHIRFEVFNVPALDPVTDESNFEYRYGVGFSTQMYQQIRSSFERGDDIASWLAQYQGEPIERTGVLFSPDDFRYYNGTLPQGVDPDRIFMAVDPAWGGGDYVASPIIYQYGNDMYVHDVVFNKGDKRETQPEIVRKAIENGVQAIYVEGTRVTADYGSGLNDILNERGYRLNLQTSSKHFTGGGKFERICDKAPDIKEFMVFRENGCRDKEYQNFMENVFSFKFSKSSKQHDDAPDSLAMAIAFAYRGEAKAEIMKRLW